MQMTNIGSHGTGNAELSPIVTKQYDGKAFPLHQCFMREIPAYIIKTAYELSDLRLALFRGGLAFIFITGDTSYPLKDLDLLAEKDMLMFLD